MNELIEYLRQFVTTQRFELLNSRLERRTRYCTVLLEDIFQPQNASAVLRTCDCFGIQDVHIIENKNAYRINRDVVLGSAQWLQLYRYNKQKTNNTPAALQELRSRGYRIVATLPREEGVSVHNFDMNKGPFVLCFGSERPGLSKGLLSSADEYLYIPMVGFTESLNISVAVAICLQNLQWKLQNSQIDWHLTKSEKEIILLDWMKKSIKSSDLIINEYYKRNPGING